MSSTSAAGAALESATNLGDSSCAPTSNAPSPTAVSSELTPAPEAATTQSALQSQPMTASVSVSSDHQNVNGNDAANIAGSYGTRSRHRPGRARPNYADDKEIDAEIEATGKYAKLPKKSSGTNVAVVPVQSMDLPSARDEFAVVNGTGPTTNTAGTIAHSSIDGQSHTQLTAAPSKKRKQPGSSTTVPVEQPPHTKPKTSSTFRPQFTDTNVMSFEGCRKRLNSQEQLVADDGTTIQVNDHMYFICEPPGEPYYFGRIMEFLHEEGKDASHSVEAVRVNWFYRPKDIQRRVQDTRVAFASMHSDTCPLSSMRGKCNIQHSADIPNLDEFRKQSDSFWFNQLYDRYMQRYYEVVPTSKVVNVPRRVKKVLDERWRFVLIEIGRSRELTSASKVCKRCTDFAANDTSVDCAVCKNTYHMSCVRPPLLRKPARGFAWACAACSRAQELRMEARHTPLSENELSRIAEADSLEDEEDDVHPHDHTTRESSAGPEEEHPPPTPAQLSQANIWQWRYLGIHSKPEDALDFDDRIYPRASSRLGPRHQANVTVWHGRPAEFIKAAEGKRKYKPTGGNKKDAKAAALQENDKREKRPKWVFDEPPGFVARGLDEPIELKGKKEYTAQLTFKMPDPSRITERGLDDDERPENYDVIVDAFLERCDNEVAPKYKLGKGNVDIRTKAVEKLQENNYDTDKALQAMLKLSAKMDLKLPELTQEEVRRFEEGVARYGSELHAVARHVSPTIKESRIVRFYYQWKKTEKGKEIWGNYENRKSKKDSKRVEKDADGSKLQQDVADDGDDSAFDNEKAARVKRGFKCKFCATTSSRTWRRAPATAPGTLVPREPSGKGAKDKSNWLVSALCGKCAYLWRRYAVQYESIEEIGKKIAVSGGRASKRKVDEELMRIVLEAQNFAGDIITKNTAQIATTAGIEVPIAMVESDELLKKRTKVDNMTPEIIVEKKKVVPEKPVELEPLKAEPPRVKEHPCAVCHVLHSPDHKMLKCRDCRLHVHAPCYGTTAPVGTLLWYCDMCKNDHNTQVSTNYECVLCPVRRTPQELMEPPKVSHKKKTDREREKERSEREMVQEAGRRWREDQLAAGRPVDPREPLKRTAWNNWMHVNCAVWTKEIRFGDAEHLDAAEGVGFIPKERFEMPCKYCNETGFPTVTCQIPACSNTFHVGCAHQRRMTFGFDISPVKTSRRDSVPTMKLDQESGLAVPGIWCTHHAVPTIVHSMLEHTSTGLTALQEYVRTYKQVDSTTTGTVRRAAQFQSSAQPASSTGLPTQRRTSTLNGYAHQPIQIDPVTGREVESPSPLSPQPNGDHIDHFTKSRQSRPTVKSEKKCCTCPADYSPKWWTVKTQTASKIASPASQMNGVHHPSENGPVKAGTTAQLPSPEPLQRQASSAPDSAAVPAISSDVKPEPIDLDTMDVPAEMLYQCHKCHVNRRTPPPSPSIARHRHRLHLDPVEEPPAPAPSHALMPSGPQPMVHSPHDGPPHSHPPMHVAGPPSHVYQTGRPPYHGPQMMNGGPPGPHMPVMYGGPPPHYRPSDYGYPYPPPPMHYAVPGSLPPAGARPNIPQHSPPPGPYSHIHAGPPPPSGPPSGHPGSPHVGPISGPGITTYMHRTGESPNLPYSPLHTYPPPPPPSHVQSRMSVPGLSQIVPPTHEHVNHVRGPSEGSISTPLLGMSRPSNVPESPRMAHQVREETSRDIERERNRRLSTAGVGASASPNLRHLLS